MTALLKENGATFVAAARFRPPPAAKAAQLLIIVGGPTSAIESISPYMAGALTEVVIQAGDKSSNAVLLKTTIQYLHGGIIYLICETNTFAEKVGLPLTAVSEMLEKTFGPYVQSLCQQLTSGAYIPAEGESPWIPAELCLKHVGNWTSMAKDVGIKLKSTKPI